MEKERPITSSTDELVQRDNAQSAGTILQDTTVSATPCSPSSALPSDQFRGWTNRAFAFLGSASNETLGACAIGLAASTYLVLGRIGLVLIGAFGGVLLHATWDGSYGSNSDGSSSDVQQRKRELGAEIVKRTLDLRQKNRNESDDKTDKIEASTATRRLDFSTYPSATAKALSSLTDAVIRDYVKWWYSPILPGEETFPAESRQVLVAFIHSFTNHISRRRAADPFLDFFVNSTSVLIVFFNELSSAIKSSQRQDVSIAIQTYLEFQPDSNLANVTNADQQKQKLDLVADDILQNFLDSKTYNCVPARCFLREVLAGLILGGTLESCSKPEWINNWIVYLLEDEQPELIRDIDRGIVLGEQAGTTNTEKKRHQRRMSRAEQAMQDAMLEAQRMNEMIAEEEASKNKSEADDTASTSTTDRGIATPSSSGSDQPVTRQRVTSDMFDAEGNNIPSLTASPVKSKKIPTAHPTFTNFDQLEIAQSPMPTPPTTEPPGLREGMLAIPLSLHHASITIMDMGESNDQIVLRQKPSSEMLIQVEPASNRYPGWMVTKQYSAFEPLYEALRRIANISGVVEFNLKYPEMPAWRGKNRATLIATLEQYLKEALKSERLAESGTMKAFLERDTGLEKAQSKNVFVQAGAGLENVGKGFVNVIGQGGKGLQTGIQTGGKVFQTGGKAVLGGVTGVFGAVASGVSGAPKRPVPRTTGSSASVSRLRQTESVSRSSFDTGSESPQRLASARNSTDLLRTTNSSSQDLSRTLDQENLNLPPPPDQMTDEWQPVNTTSQPASSRPSLSISRADPSEASRPSEEAALEAGVARNERAQDTPISEEETRTSVELMFAIITELLSLSSVWTFRQSLLTVAKSYLLRPRNPQLESIRQLIQESVINANLSDEGIAKNILKVRENALPTEEELAKWPKELTGEEKEKLRVKARKLLVEKGMPQALTTVVGVAASGEALGKLFDSLQVREVARGLIFALMLQAIRSVTQ